MKLRELLDAINPKTLLVVSTENEGIIWVKSESQIREVPAYQSFFSYFEVMEIRPESWGNGEYLFIEIGEGED